MSKRPCGGIKTADDELKGCPDEATIDCGVRCLNCGEAQRREDSKRYRRRLGMVHYSRQSAIAKAKI